MIQDFQDNLVLADQAENLSVWITLVYMSIACQGHCYILNTQKAFLKIPSFTIVYLLGVCILFSQGVSTYLRPSIRNILTLFIQKEKRCCELFFL